MESSLGVVTMSSPDLKTFTDEVDLYCEYLAHLEPDVEHLKDHLETALTDQNHIFHNKKTSIGSAYKQKLDLAAAEARTLAADLRSAQVYAEHSMAEANMDGRFSEVLFAFNATFEIFYQVIDKAINIQNVLHDLGLAAMAAEHGSATDIAEEVRLWVGKLQEWVTTVLPSWCRKHAEAVEAADVAGMI